MNWTLLIAVSAVFFLAAAVLVFLNAARRPPLGADASRREIDDCTCAATLYFWGQIYRSNNFKRRVTFEQFMTNPRGYTTALCFTKEHVDPHRIEQLLPAQQHVFTQRLLDDQLAAEADRAERKHMEMLQTTYQVISTNDNRLSPMHPERCTKWWKSGRFPFTQRHA